MTPYNYWNIHYVNVNFKRLLRFCLKHFLDPTSPVWEFVAFLGWHHCKQDVFGLFGGTKQDIYRHSLWSRKLEKKLFFAIICHFIDQTTYQFDSRWSCQIIWLQELLIHSYIISCCAISLSNMTACLQWLQPHLHAAAVMWYWQTRAAVMKLLPNPCYININMVQDVRQKLFILMKNMYTCADNCSTLHCLYSLLNLCTTPKITRVLTRA